MVRQRDLAASLGGWSARHRFIAITGWLLLVVVATMIGSAVGQVQMTQSEYGTGESGRAERILADAGLAKPAGEMVLLHSDTATADASGFQAAVRSVVSGVQDSGQVQGARDPIVSKDRHDVLIQFAMKGDPDTADQRVQPVLDAVAKVRAGHPELTIEQFGDGSANLWFNETIAKDFTRAEWTAVPLALGILLATFGAFVAALLPVALAMTAFLAASGMLAVISHAMHLDSSASSVMLLMGLAVGVDYCLFYLRREREERAAGRDPQTALQIAAATSGRSVLISGLTVMVAMAGMFLSGMQLFAGFALATILVVFIAMVGSVTVLPALLSLLGDKVNAGRLPFLRKRSRSAAGGGRVWNAVLGPVLARPKIFALGSAGLLLLLAAPVTGLHTEQLSINKALPPDAPIVRTYDHIMAAFPGGPDPARVVVKMPDIQSVQAKQAIAAFEQAAQRTGETGQSIHTTVHAAAGVAEIEVPLAGDGSDATSRHALTTLREKVVPGTLAKVPGSEAVVGGSLAASVDFNAHLRLSIIPVFIFVLAITFGLMLVTFRSIVIAATSIVLNLLSVAAAYGALVMVFQHGWGDSLVGTEAPGAIVSWIPLFVFVVLFGLSMDYNVFVVSRIKEAHDHGLPTRQAVDQGIRATAGVVTSAAAIMVAVFAIFGTLSMQQMKQLGVGLAVAVLLDATIIRAVLLPSVMVLLGERNWYLPRWANRAPTPAHAAQAEGPKEPAPATGSGVEPRTAEPHSAT